MIERAESTDSRVVALQDVVYTLRMLPDLHLEVIHAVEPLGALASAAFWWDLLDPDARQAVLEGLQTLDGEVLSQTLDLLLPDGSRVVVSHKASKSRARDGSTLVTGTLNRLHSSASHSGPTDVEAERAILRATLDAQPDPLVLLETVVDDNGCVVDLSYVEANDAACRALRLQRSQVVGGLMSALHPHTLQTGLLGLCLEVVATGEPLVLSNYPYGTNEQSQGRYDVRVIPAGDGVTLSWTDVSERYRAARELEISQAKYRLMLEESSDVTTFHDPDGYVQWVSPAIHRVLGWPADLSPREILRLVHPDDIDRVRATRDRLASGEATAATRLRMRACDGSYRWMESTARAVRNNVDHMDAMVVISRDIQDQMDFEQALSDSESRYRLVAENTIDVVYRTDKRGTIEWVSDGIQGLLGLQPAQLVGTSGWDLVAPEDVEDIMSAISLVVTGHRRTVRAQLHAVAGPAVWVEVAIHPVRDEQGVPIAYVGGLREVQAQVEAEQALDLLARTDDLTGLVNRREALARLTQWVNGGEAQGLAVAFIDIDRFKTVNDRLGHAAGDVVLRQVAERILGCVRGSDVVARMGGDEILLLMRGIGDLDVAVGVAEKIRASVSQPDADGSPTTVSIGLTMMRPGDDVDSLVARADTAMYLAKKQGRDQVVRVD